MAEVDVNDLINQMQAQGPQPQLVNVVDPDSGEVGSLPAEQLPQALGQGYTQATPDDITAFDQKKYSSPMEGAKAFLEGAGVANSFGLSTGAERLLGAKPEDIAGREEAHPWLHGAGEIAGLALSSLYGVGEATALKAAGEGAASLVGLGEAGTTLAKVGSSAVKLAAENALMGAGDETSKLITGATPLTAEGAETALTHIGLSGLFGAGLGALGTGVVSPLWQATAGPKVSAILQGLRDKLGGIEGVTSEPINDAIDQSGVEVNPIMRSALSDDVASQQRFKDLRQSPSPSGLEVAQASENLQNNLGHSVAEAFEKSPEEIGDLQDLSEAQAGKTAANTLSQELKTAIEPMEKTFEDLKATKSGIDLPQDQTLSDPNNPYVNQTIPGAASEMTDKLAQLSQNWLPDSDIYKVYNQVVKNLPKLKTIGDLTGFISKVGSDHFDYTNPGFNRQVQEVLSVLREGEANATMGALREEAPEMIAAHQEAKTNWAAASEIKDVLQSRLHLKSGKSMGSFINELQAAADENPEKILRRLSNSNDSFLSKTLAENFPETAKAIKDYQLSTLLKAGARGASEKQVINPTNFFRAIDKLSPEMRASLLSPEAAQKLEGTRTLWEAYSKLGKDYNFSNTAPTLTRLLKNVPGTALGFISALTGHNPVVSAILGGLTNTVSRNAPDAMKLALLKWSGASAPIEAGGFKAMVDFIDSTMKGENLLSKASKNLFRAGEAVIPSHLVPDDKQRKKLDSRLKSLQDNPNDLLNIGGKTSYYMPEHNQALAQTATTAANYLNSIRPTPSKQSPLDATPEVPAPQLKAFNRALDIAEQPLTVLDRVKEGTVTPQDLQHFSALYPNLLNRTRRKVSEELMNHVNDEKPVPYHTRMGLSLFLGQPLDSTMAPGGIQSTQSTFQMGPSPSQQQAQAPMRGHKVPENAFKKLSSMDESVLDTRAMSRGR